MKIYLSAHTISKSYISAAIHSCIQPATIYNIQMYSIQIENSGKQVTIKKVCIT